MRRGLRIYVSLLVSGIVFSACGVDKKVEEDQAHIIVDVSEEAAETDASIETKEQFSVEETIETNEEEPIADVPEQEEFVKVKEFVDGICVELKYSTTDNFTRQKIYDFSEAYLRYGTVEKLRNVQEDLKAQGLSLKIWDAFRPTEAQFVLWEVCPDASYVANPNKGFSSHSRGNTIDLTLVDKEGNELVMPTGFDDFSALADRNYSDCSEEARKNAELLEQVMTNNGFQGYFGEWWHFTDIEEYPVEQEFVICTEEE